MSKRNSVKVSRVGPLSYGKFSGIIMAFTGFLIGIFYALVILLGPSLGTDVTEADPVMTAMGYGSLIIFPVLYGVLGFLLGIVGGALYNLCAKWFGGIELELETEK